MRDKLTTGGIMRSLRFAFVIPFVAICILLVACTSKQNFSKEQSKDNFIDYQKAIEEAIKPYGYTLGFDKTYTNNNDIYNALTIYLNGMERIDILMLNEYGKHETFTISYVLWGDDAVNRKYDIQLFVDIINSFYNDEIKPKEIDKFLNSPEGKYDVHIEGSDVKIHKRDDFRLFETWGLSYVLTMQNEGTLTFNG